MSRTASVAACLLLLLAACGSPTEDVPDPSDDAREGELLIADVERAEPEGADVEALVEGMTRFGIDVFGEMAGPGANVVLSPASIAIAFGMARAGAHGATAEEIDVVLGFPADPAAIHASFNALDRLLDEAAPAALGTPDPDATRRPDESEPPALEVANSVFPQVGFPVREDYLATLAARYGAGVIPVDFASERAKEIIDGWVEERTRGRIDRLFDRLDPATRLVLANAIYLKADWLLPFGGTEDLPFTLADGSQVSVPTMRHLENMRYAEGDGWQAVELPYAGERLAMWVLVPAAGQGPGDVLTPEVLDAVGRGSRRAPSTCTCPGGTSTPTWS